MKNALLDSASASTVARIPNRPLADSRDAIRLTFVGNLHRIDGRQYALTDEEQVFDTETGERILDSDIANQVFDLHAEDLRIAAEIRNKAKALAKGDFSMEEMLRLHFAFGDLSNAQEIAGEQGIF